MPSRSPRNGAAACQGHRGSYRSGAGDRDEVGIAGPDDHLGLVEVRDEPDCDGRQTGRSFDGSRERHLVARPDRDLLRRRLPPLETSIAVAAPCSRARPRRRSSARGPSRRQPSRCPTPARSRAGPEGTQRAPRRTPRAETHAILEAPAVVVLAPVAERREELVQQVAVRRVDLDRIEPEPPRPRGPHRRRRRGRLPCPRGSSATGGWLTVRERQGRWGDRLPAAGLAGPDLPAAFPGHARRGLAPGMGELDPERHRRSTAGRFRAPARAPLPFRRTTGPGRPG